jgi:two-component system, chemotaxis family, response regulator PixG
MFTCGLPKTSVLICFEKSQGNKGNLTRTTENGEAMSDRTQSAAILKALAQESTHPAGPAFISLLDSLHGAGATGQLQILAGPVRWLVQLNEGWLVCASHNVAPFQRLLWHLRRYVGEEKALHHQILAKFARIRGEKPIPEYAAVSWLLSEQAITPQQAVKVLERQTQEALSALLSLERGQCSFVELPQPVSSFCQFDPLPLLSESLEEGRGWQALGSEFWSPYQRPRLLVQHPLVGLPQLHQQFRNLLQGDSFRYLSSALNRDDLDIARGILPYVQAGVVILEDPQSPFNHLPKWTP